MDRKELEAVRSLVRGNEIVTASLSATSFLTTTLHHSAHEHASSMASWLSFSSPVDVDVRLEGEDARKHVEIKMDKDRREKCPVFYDGENMRGTVSRWGCWGESD